ncbi:MAG: Holliday junction branch migration protein RuvA [Candidatus Marinimicrobia bacterium]|nr:Holliday junction branch migration protein RuvA [Candidatus Neomarinimicrobiota bacterium]
MYEYIAGKLTNKEPTFAVIDVNGVGYQVHIPLTTFESLPDLNEKTKLLIYHYVREDDQRLYGFFTQEERKLFLMLIGISGIGPKTAMTMLSGATPAEFKKRIVTQNVKALTRIPGIGKKTAKRIIMELNEKIEDIPGAAEGEFISSSKVATSTPNSTAIDALVELGYNKNKANRAVSKAVRKLGDEATVQDYIKYALSNM